MTKNESVQRNFRPWPENGECIEYAKELGLNVSKIINKVLKRHLKTEVEREVENLRRKLNMPVP